MPKNNPKPSYSTLSKEQLSGVISMSLIMNPEMSEAEADAILYDALEGPTPFKTEYKNPVSMARNKALESGFITATLLSRGEDTTEAVKSLNREVFGFKDSAIAYADAIANNYPDNKQEMLSVKSRLLSPYYSGELTDVNELITRLESLKELVDKCFVNAEISIVESRKKHAKTDTPAHQTDEYPILTGAAPTQLLQSMSDGKYEKNWTLDAFGDTMIHKSTRHGYGVVLTRIGNESLTDIVKMLDADSCLSMLYITQLVTREAGKAAPSGTIPVGTIDLADVARKTYGGEFQTKEDAANAIRKVWHTIRYCSVASVQGERHTPYRLPDGTLIDTKISNPIFMLGGTQYPADWTPAQRETPPLRVEIALTRDWYEHVIHPQIWEFLPYGEIIGAIPGDQTGGAWGRCLGMAWMIWCRCNAKEAVNPTGKRPTRRELLKMHLPKKSPYFEVLDGNDPKRAIQHFEAGEGHLSDAALIARLPKATERKVMTSKSDRPRKGWADIWLDETLIDWQPGPRIFDTLGALAAKTPTPKPIDFKAKPKKPRTRKKKGD